VRRESVRQTPYPQLCFRYASNWRSKSEVGIEAKVFVVNAMTLIDYSPEKAVFYHTRRSHPLNAQYTRLLIALQRFKAVLSGTPNSKGLARNPASPAHPVWRSSFHGRSPKHRHPQKLTPELAKAGTQSQTSRESQGQHRGKQDYCFVLSEYNELLFAPRIVFRFC
jgi:hypothetical protein